jgi:esterase/lipase superfamily enzyme
MICCAGIMKKVLTISRVRPIRVNLEAVRAMIIFRPNISLDVERMTKHMTRFCLLAILITGVAACGGKSPFEIDLMPAPEVYEEDGFNPLADASPMSDLPYEGVLFATDRAPATEDSKERFYLNDRGDYLRLGVAQIQVTDTDMTWEEARRVSLLKNRSSKYPLSVTSVEEFGGLDRSLDLFAPPEWLGEDPHAPAAKYAEAINAQLAVSDRKHIYIYVHGYKVVLENPILVATELWHFLGYDGVFIA